MNASDPDASRLNILYKDFPEYFVWVVVDRKWKLRKLQMVVGRLCTVSPFKGERYFLRLLLINIRCPKSFNDLKMVAGHQYSTFREACIHRGLLESDEYVDSCLSEAALFEMPYCLRSLFSMLLVYGITGDTQKLWDKYYHALSEDFGHDGLCSPFDVLHKTVSAVDAVLMPMDRCIFDFPIKFVHVASVRLDKYSKDYMHECSIKVSDEDILSIDHLNAGQQVIYDKITRKILSGGHGSFFLDGPGGTGKTFLYRALLAFVRSNGEIALAVASSGVAAFLLPGGRTAHSRFKLPFDAEDKSNSKISKQGSLAKMIYEAKLIIWDEASMANRYSIESLDFTLADICDKSKPFGGTSVLFGGDFPQTLPIIVRGSREALINASFVSSHLWKDVEKLHLHENMRAREDPLFTNFLLHVGNGDIPYIYDDIRIPSHMLVPFVDINSSLDELIRWVYPSFDDFLTNPHLLVGRDLLTPKNDCVAELNNLLMDRFLGETKEYVSFNRTDDALQQAEYDDYLTTVSTSGLSPHILKLKKNCTIMLLRNLNPVQGLCNGTRLICKQLGDNFIGAEISTGDFKGHYVFIPRIPLESSDKALCPIPFKRHQFPIRPCFAMTINKAQGQILDFVGIYLREPVFSHGQFYVGISRAKTSNSVKILIHPDSKMQGCVDFTKNIVYKDIFLFAAIK